MKERLYAIRFRLRDGLNRVWELHHKHLNLHDAQELTDQLWDRGMETMITVVGTEWDNLT